ncbi:MAG: metallophosphoesterase [Micrococcaceae bacterium]
MNYKKLFKVAAGSSAATLFYANAIERRNFALRFDKVKILEPGAKPITVLHIADLHMMPNQLWKETWVGSLAKYQPDFIVNTGDSLSSPKAIPAIKRALSPFAGIPGVFVAGSNDYIAPTFRNPAKYLFAPSNQHKTKDIKPPKLDMPYMELGQTFERFGWTNIINGKENFDILGSYLKFSGVNDPHMELDEFQGFLNEEVPGVKIGVIHAPYIRVLDEFTEAGSQLIFAGHTHGGQLRIPFYGAIVANCDIPLEKSRGLHTWESGVNTSYINVSAGLGNSPYFPFRFACRPEASLITLLPKDA